MKITKIGRCCLLIEEASLRILTDPGIFTTGQNELEQIDYVLFTHEHPDHFHEDSLRTILLKNPRAKVITNRGVTAKLALLGIKTQLLEHGQSVSLNGLRIEGFGQKHAEIYRTITPVDNTGYFFNEKFFYPGDCLFNPKKELELLALPVAGPWLKLSESIDYALEIKPKQAFPVHDGMLRALGSTHTLPETILKSQGIAFTVPQENIIIEI